MQHVHNMRVIWPNGTRKEQYIKHEAATESLLVPNQNYVLLRRFSAKEQRRRLTAAPYLARQFNSSVVGLENHLNYIHRPGGTLSEDEAYGLAALYSSSLLDVYFRSLNGNTQVNATEFRAMPLPELKVITAIGRQVMTSDTSEKGIDDLILNTLGAREQTLKATKVAASG
jgi:adenine-specific DNA-methyltransferase